jgi:hypothetical protein
MVFWLNDELKGFAVFTLLVDNMLICGKDEGG